MESFLEYAQEYLARGRSIIPLYPSHKSPFFELLPIGAHGKATWKPYSLTPANLEEATRWSRDSGNRANIGQVMGKVSNVFGIDVDFRHGGEATWRELSGGVDIPTETTLTGDGFHLIFKYPGYKFKFREKLPGIDLRSDNSYLVAPPSIHPSGKPYSFHRRGVILGAPDFLVEQMVPDGTDDVGDSVFTHTCGNKGESVKASSDWSVGWRVDQNFLDQNLDDARVVQALRVFKTCEAQRSRYPSLSDFDYGVMVKLFNRDYDFETIYAAFHFAVYGTHYRKRLEEQSPQAAVSYLQRMWAKVVEQPSFVRDKTEVSLHANQLREQVESRVWKGSGGKSDKALLLAHIDYCVLANRKSSEGDYLWDVSVRDLGEKAKLGIKTVCKANGRLIQAGWLLRSSGLRSSPNHSFCYQFGKAWTQGNTLTPSLLMSTCVPSRPRPDTYGVFENRAGLGKGCEATWWALIDGCRTMPELEMKTGSHPKTIKRHIKKMSEVGMVVIVEDRFEPAVDFDFKQLGEFWETTEISRRRAEKHDKQRQTYALGINQREQRKNEQSANDNHEL